MFTLDDGTVLDDTPDIAQSTDQGVAQQAKKPGKCLELARTSYALLSVFV